MRMQISMRGPANVVEALATSCERVDLHWSAYHTTGQSTGLGALPNVKWLSLNGFRCSYLIAQLKQGITMQACLCPVHVAADGRAT